MIGPFPRLAAYCAASAELDMGQVHPRVGSGWVGSGPSVWVCVGHPGLYKNNVTLSVIIKFTQFSELLVLLELFSL